MPVHHIVEGLSGDAKSCGGVCDGESKGLDAIMTDMLARMRWVLHQHGSSSGVVYVVHIHCVLVLNAEDNSPICSDSNRPEAFQVAFERVQFKPGRIHVFWCLSGIQAKQNAPDLLNVGSWQSSAVVILE